MTIIHNKTILVILLGIILISGCIQSREDQLLQEAGQKLTNTLDDYYSISEETTQYDLECVKRLMMNNCYTANPTATEMECKMKIGFLDPMDRYWSNYPQCKK